jgi:hypothetical protein
MDADEMKASRFEAERDRARLLHDRVLQSLQPKLNNALEVGNLDTERANSMIEMENRYRNNPSDGPDQINNMPWRVYNYAAGNIPESYTPRLDAMKLNKNDTSKFITPDADVLHQSNINRQEFIRRRIEESSHRKGAIEALDKDENASGYAAGNTPSAANLDLDFNFNIGKGGNESDHSKFVEMLHSAVHEVVNKHYGAELDTARNIGIQNPSLLGPSRGIDRYQRPVI